MSMNVWKDTKRIFLRAAVIKCPPERRAYVQGACRASPALRAEVESLLAHRNDSGRLCDGHSWGRGTRLLHYELLERIGAGSRGLVYKARDTRLGRLVALKILPPILAMDFDSRSRFLREAHCAAALSHPSIVAIHEIAQDKGVCFFTMEYVPGRTLREMISDHGLPVQRCLNLSIQIAEALVKAHALHIIHRDLKPSNILVTREGRVKVVDFGLAKPLPPRGSANLDVSPTFKGMILGTAGYMSPEQVRAQRCDGRSDIFSFGVLLHETLSGRRLFARRSSIESMSAVLTEQPPELPQRVPESVRKIVSQCLEKKPARRFQEMRQVLRQLKAAAFAGPRDR